MANKPEPLLDKCPGYNLYIGGFVGLRRTQALKNCHITHIVSVLDWEFKNDAPLIRGYQHLHIPVDDVEDENLLEWFPRSNAFIKSGLEYDPGHHASTGKQEPDDKKGGDESGVYIHCAMGKSRSATILLAYLLWASRLPHNRQKQQDSTDMVAIPQEPLTVIKALEILRQGRPLCEPNEGFMHQLHMYEDMGCPTTDEELKKHKIYRRWMNQRKVEESVRVMQAPEMDHILFEDEVEDEAFAKSHTNRKSHMQEIAPGISAPDGTDQAKSLSHPSTAGESQVNLKCRKCRHVLATTPFILEHTPPPHKDPAFNTQPIGDSPLPPPQCAHIFLHPLSWMRGVLSESQMEGRLICPNKKCGTNIGKFAWTGLRCSCGGWVTPGFALIRTKVDESVIRGPASKRSTNILSRLTADSTATGTSQQSSSAGGIRLPPHMRGKGNL